MIDFKRKFYCDKFNCKFLGVCAGLADYFEVEAIWVRLGFIALFFYTNFLVILLYFAIAILTKKKPPHLYTDSLTRTFSSTHSADLADEIAPATRKGIDQ